jgi:hypothetical protein
MEDMKMPYQEQQPLPSGQVMPPLQDPMMGQMPQDFYGQSQFSSPYSGNNSIMQQRIDVSNLLMNIETNLRGGYWKEHPETGKREFIRLGRQKMNDEGIQTFMFKLNLIIGSHTVQGNYSPEMYSEYIFWLDRNVSRVLIENRVKWNLAVEDYWGLCEDIRHACEPFFSRLIGNKERESYASTVRSTEVYRPEEKQGWLSRIGFGGR